MDEKDKFIESGEGLIFEDAPEAQDSQHDVTTRFILAVAGQSKDKDK